MSKLSVSKRCFALKCYVHFANVVTQNEQLAGCYEAITFECINMVKAPQSRWARKMALNENGE